MLRGIFFVGGTAGVGPEQESCVAAEMDRAVHAFRRTGFESGILSAADREGHRALPSPDRMSRVLLLCDDPALLRRLRAEGYRAAGYLHSGNASASFSGVPYILQEPDLVDADSYHKIYEREAGLPWTILETPRCLVREFTTEDLEAIYGLYDKEALRFLEPPSEDRAHEEEVLRAYIQRIYGLYGFGHWAVLLKNSALIGRIGYAAITAKQEQEALDLGVREPGPGQGSGIDADFGFLLAAPYRGQGIAEEVCRALLEYGFTGLGFSRVRADASTENEGSIRLLKKLGFKRVGTVRDRTEDGKEYTETREVFILDASGCYSSPPDRA